MKVFILALDGLDYDLVTGWKLKHLQQKVCGKIFITEELCVKTKLSWLGGKVSELVPYTPIVWTSFITGKPPDKHKVRFFWTYGKLIDKIRNLPPLNLIKGKRHLLSKLGVKIKPRTPRKKDIKIATIFDMVKPSIAVDVFPYNEPPTYKMRIRDVGKGGIGETIKLVEQIHRVKIRKTLAKLAMPDWKLFMTYFELADYMGHIYRVKNLKKLWSYYKMLNELAFTLQEKVGKNTVFLVISDHGMQPSKDGITGNHSRYAFWSLNMKTDWRPKGITDFYPQILEWTKENRK